MMLNLKNNILLKISFIIGSVGLIGGWLIFLTWATARYGFAYDFNDLESIGFLWMVAFFYLGAGALVLLLIHVIANRRKLRWNTLLCFLVILSGIPSVFFILKFHSQIEDKVFIKLHNSSSLDNLDINLVGNYKSWKLGTLNSHSSFVFNYDPPYFVGDGRQYRKHDSLSFVIENDLVLDTLTFPCFNMGDCAHLTFDDSLKININK